MRGLDRAVAQSGVGGLLYTPRPSRCLAANDSGAKRLSRTTELTQSGNAGTRVGERSAKLIGHSPPPVGKPRQPLEPFERSISATSAPHGALKVLQQ